MVKFCSIKFYGYPLLPYGCYSASEGVGVLQADLLKFGVQGHLAAQGLQT